MSLTKFNKRNRLFPWNNENLRSFFTSDNFFENDFFNDYDLMPAMNVKEHENEFEIEFAIPGFDKKDFEITIDGDVLMVSGEKKTEAEEEEDNYTRKEFSYNTFKRSLQLPSSVNTDEKVNATYNDGILKLNLLKTEASKSTPKKKIDIV